MTKLQCILSCCLLTVGCRRASTLEAASDQLGGDAAPQSATAPASSRPASTPSSTRAPTPAPTPTPTPTVAPATGSSRDSPTISTSSGASGGYVVLWPRVVPSSRSDALRKDAQLIQSQLRALIERSFPGKAIDVRPEPERSCRRAGCEGVAVSLMFARKDQGCVVLAVVTAPGPVDGSLVPWVGGITLDRTEIPFRDPPENHATVRDYAACSDLAALMRQGEQPIVEAIRRASP